MAWSSFAHLPTNEEEYWYILSNLQNGMSIQEVDAIIAEYKGKEKVQHHYRSNLAKVGLFNIEQNCITLNYDIKRLSKNKKYLKVILNGVLTENQPFEMKEVAKAIMIKQSYNLQEIVDVLENEYPLIERNSLVRWVRPIVCLMKIADILSNKPVQKTSYVKFLQESFIKTDAEFGNPEPLELVEVELKKIDVSLNIVMLLDKILEDFNIRFKIELLMMPSWATKNKSYKIGEDMYTHIKIKSDLLKEDE
jgi:hypothetical protein